MNLIDRYVNAVTERLPIDTRDDVSKELRANIEDMLPEKPTEENIRAVLEKLGNPVKLSEEYNQSKRYLIGPALYDSYISVLKIVLGVVTAVLLCVVLLEKLLTPPDNMGIIELSVELFTSLIVGAIQGLTQAFLWVTVTFAIMERSGINEGSLPFARKKWSVDDLTTLPVSDKSRITRGEVIFSMVCTILFTVLFYNKPEFFGWYEIGGNETVRIISFFNVDRIHAYMFIIIILAIYQLCISIYKLISKRWNLPIAIANTVNNAASSILIFFMANDASLFNQEFTSKFADAIGISLAQATASWSKGILIFLVVIIGLNILDSISGFFKCKD
ncbi:MAG: hypothetical protein K0S55_206 [Clostridia bacterium]|nr:hypothetical protein [Clostridia bacterium]